jgi:hypothetical protein
MWLNSPTSSHSKGQYLWAALPKKMGCGDRSESIIWRGSGRCIGSSKGRGGGSRARSISVMQRALLAVCDRPPSAYHCQYSCTRKFIRKVSHRSSLAEERGERGFPGDVVARVLISLLPDSSISYLGIPSHSSISWAFCLPLSLILQVPSALTMVVNLKTVLESSIQDMRRSCP